MITDGGEAICDIDVLRHKHLAFGPVASAATCWRVLDDAVAHLNVTPAINAGGGVRDGVDVAELTGLEAGTTGIMSAWANRRHDVNGAYLASNPCPREMYAVRPASRPLCRAWRRDSSSALGPTGLRETDARFAEQIEVLVRSVERASPK